MVIIKLFACAAVAIATGAATFFSTGEPASDSAAVAPQHQLAEKFHPPLVDINRLADAFR